MKQIIILFAIVLCSYGGVAIAKEWRTQEALRAFAEPGDTVRESTTHITDTQIPRRDKDETNKTNKNKKTHKNVTPMATSANSERHESPLNDKDIEIATALGYSFLVADGENAKNNNEAIKWLKKPAEQGNTKAQIGLGVAYHGEKNFNDAKKWFLIAAYKGDSRGQYYLGALYSNGDGVALDNKEAKKWFSMSAEQGYSDAQKALSTIVQNETKSKTKFSPSTVSTPSSRSTRDMSNLGDFEIILSLLGTLVVMAIPIMLMVGFTKKTNQAKQKNIDTLASNKSSLTDSLSGAIDKLPIKTNIARYSYYNTAFAISPSDNKLIIIYGDSPVQNNKTINCRKQHIYDFDNITGVEIDINGNNVTSPSIGGAIAGGILFGGAGAIIGASNTTSIKNIKSISLKLYLDDLSNPYHELNVFQSSNIMVQKISGVNPAWEGLYPEHPEVQEALNTVNEWYGRFRAILDKKVAHTVKIPQNKTTAVSVADELEKLATLKDNGILSGAEFEMQKLKLLS